MKYRETATDIFWEIAGSFLIAVATYNFALGSDFLLSGFSGVALILHRLFGAPIGLTTIAMNIPVALLCYKLIGREFMLKSLRCMVISSLMVDYVAPLLPSYAGAKILSALVTGTLSGIGYAVIYMRQSSTGGADFIIMAAKALRPHLKLSTIVFWADVGVVAAGGLIFRDVDGIIYGMLILLIITVAVDKVMCGINAGKVGLIVTSRGSEICAAIDRCTGRGSTILSGTGGYTQTEKQVVMVACSTKEMYNIEKAVKRTDDGSFMIIMSSSEVHGEGFRVV